MLFEACQNYKNAPAKIREAMLKLQNMWVKIEIQLGVVKVIWNELGEELQILQNQTLQVSVYRIYVNLETNEYCSSQILDLTGKAY